ncbi:MAG: hypothetical protein KC505_02595, partial [Myxococcales bacterium]|nr:hypothetical protein [Myxococcales bacterium]
MKFTLSSMITSDAENDLLAFGLFKSKAEKKKSNAKEKATCQFESSDSVNELDKQLNNHLIKSATDEGFCAEENQTFVTSSLGISKPKIIALMGLGDHHLQSVDLFRRFGGETFKIAQKKRAKKISLCIPPKTTIPLFDVVQAITEGFILASYSFDRYHTKSVKENHVKEVVIHLLEKPTPDQKLALKRAENIASSVCYARDLINEGPMELNPQAFAKHAIEVAQSCDLDVSVLDEKKLKKEKMHLMLAVGSAAEPASPPRLIRLHYKPKKNSKRVIVLVGKGVTFDSGGLDIKPADGMLDMKTDMSGAAAVFGTMRA